MPPKSRGAGRGSQRAVSGANHQNGLAGRPGNSHNVPVRPPNVYKDMLAEAASTSAGNSERPPKRRRTQTTNLDVERTIQKVEERQPSPARTSSPVSEEPAPSNSQVAFDDDFESSSEDENWEEIDIGQKTGLEEDGENGSEEEVPMQLHLDQAFEGKGKQKRKPITAVDRAHRLMIHKLHLCCLTAHLSIRNKWCNDAGVQAGLRSLAPALAVKYLNHDPRRSEFERSRAFVDGLGRICEVWRDRFRVQGRGMTRSLWDPEAEDTVVPPQEDTETITDIEEFRLAALNLQGSRDLGAQLLCALLRSLNVITRLVCSLQPLPFLFSSKVKPQRTAAPIVIESDSESDEDSDSRTASGPKRISKFGRKPKKKRVPKYTSLTPFASTAESRFPVQWVECWDPAASKWIAVDALVTKTIGKPMRLEPPATDSLVEMSYVVAIDDSGQLADVTRRYASSYNSKTRKRRVNVTKKGDAWWDKTVKHYNRGWILDRDLMDVSDLVKREASEAMPKSVQDFKDHPIYVLERHLKRNEVLHPKNPVGRVTLGKTEGPAEGVFRRSDVKTLKSATTWYRGGREIKVGEQPLKRVIAAKNRRRKSPSFDDEEQEDESTALYADFQTQPYIPPAVHNGMVPKNGYGNLDLFVPSMLPSGACHIPYAEASRAARLLGIDYADAVTGFEFKGRQGTAVIKGIVVAEENYDGVMAVLIGYEDARQAAEEENRRHNALVLWRKFFIGLQVMARLDTYDIEGEDKEARRAAKEAEASDDEEYDEDLHQHDEEDVGGGFVADTYAGGGFVSDPSDRYVHEERAHNSTYQDPPEEGRAVEDDDTGGGFFAEENVGEDGAGEGFIVEDLKDNSEPEMEVDSYEGGGFIPDEESIEEAQPEPLAIETTSMNVPKSPSLSVVVEIRDEQLNTPQGATKTGTGAVESTVKSDSALPVAVNVNGTASAPTNGEEKQRPLNTNQDVTKSDSTISSSRLHTKAEEAITRMPDQNGSPDPENIALNDNVTDEGEEEMYDSEAENEGLDFLL